MIIVRHPVTHESKNLAQWARYIGINKASMYERYRRYKNKSITIDQLFYSANLINQSNGRHLQHTRYVFRPDDVDEYGNVYSYSAYHPSNLKKEVMGAIVPTVKGDGWIYNPYPFGSYPTRNELVKAYLKWDKEN
jgi:hypothetical protein